MAAPASECQRRTIPWWVLLSLVPVLMLLIGLVGWFISVNLRAEYNYRAAEQALQRRDFTTALALLERCLEVRPGSAETHLLAARTARRAGALDDAGRHLKAYEQLKGVPEALELERALVRVQRGETEAFAGYLLGCVEKGHPDSILILEALTTGFMKTYRMNHADHCLQLWLEREPDNVQALVWRAELAERRQSSEAVDYYRRAVEVDPDHEEARLRLASGLVSLHRLDEAAKHYEFLRERHPDKADVLVGLARCRRELGQPEEAQKLLDRVLATTPGHVAALHERGRVAMEMGQLLEAEEWLRKASAASPNHQEITFTLYQCLQARGKTTEAREVLSRIEKINASLERLGDLTRKIAALPNDPELRYEAGMIFLNSGQDVEGLRWLASALKEDPRHGPTHRALADYYERTGDAARAAQHRRLADQPAQP
jgi:tetratricopeptide (TPR) repeat protein